MVQNELKMKLAHCIAGIDGFAEVRELFVAVGNETAQTMDETNS